MSRQDGLAKRSFRIREIARNDADAIAHIYGIHVAEGVGTFEEVAPTAEEIVKRIDNVLARGLPWLVAESSGALIGYAYASPFHSRSAYKFTVQSSVYVDRIWHRRGVGTKLLTSVLEACRKLGYSQVMAAVGDSRNDAALKLHARIGFRTVGHALRVGVKFGRWVDVVYLQFALTDPSDPPSSVEPAHYIAPSDQTGP